MPYRNRASKSGTTRGPLGRAAVLLCAVLLCCPAVFYPARPSGLALTLERPKVNVDWDKLPDRKKNQPKLVYAKNRLFGTVEFRGPIKKIPQWERILRLYGNKRNIDSDFSGKQAQAWNGLKAAVSKMPLMDKLQEVNKFFNRWPYRTDMDLYGIIDYWATPAEFIKNSGDCEDYAIIKMFALIQLGVNPDDMRVVLLKDQIRNIDHAVLAVYAGEEIYILDNVSPLVLPHSRYGHYKPVVSVNLSYRWGHVPPSN